MISETTCVHTMYEYRNISFNNNFTEVYLPQNLEMIESLCCIFCIRTQSCNAVFLAFKNDREGMTNFTRCSAYMVHGNDVNLTSTNNGKGALLGNGYAGVPEESKFIIIGNL